MSDYPQHEPPPQAEPNAPPPPPRPAPEPDAQLKAVLHRALIFLLQESIAVNRDVQPEAVELMNDLDAALLNAETLERMKQEQTQPAAPPQAPTAVNAPPAAPAPALIHCRVTRPARGGEFSMSKTRRVPENSSPAESASQ